MSTKMCPVCLEPATEREEVGDVRVRPLLPEQTVPYPGKLADSLESCLACWNVASRLHVDALAAAAVPAGGDRATAVAAAL